MDDQPTQGQASPGGNESQQLPPAESRLSLIRRIPPLPFAILSLGIIFFFYQVVAGGVALLLSQGKVTSENVQLVRWSTLVGQIIFILVPTLLLLKLRGHRIVSYVRLGLPDYREILLTVIAVFALQQILQGYMMAQDAVPLPGKVHDIVEQLKKAIEETYRRLLEVHSIGEFLFVVLIVALVPAFAEELLFRGLVQRSFEEVSHGMRAAVVAGVIFGAYHLNPLSFVPLAVLGIYFGFIVYRSQNIAVSISAHFFNNFIACVASFLQLDENFVVIAPGRAPSAFLVLANAVIFGLVFLVATYYFVRITESVPRTGT